MTDARRKRVNEMEELRKRDMIIFNAVSFLLGAVDLGVGATESQLEAMRIHHIDQVNTLIYDKKDLMVEDKDD